MPSITRIAKPGRARRRSGARAKLLAATETLLGRGHAFTDISVEDLIVEAGVARSTFYAHFEDKSLALLELTEQLVADLEDTVSLWYRLPPGATREDLRDALAQLVEAHSRHRAILIGVAEAAAYEPRVRAGYEALMRRRTVEIENGLRAQQSQGGVRAGVDTAQVAVWIIWLIERGLSKLRTGDDDSLRQHLDGVVEIIWRVLYDGR